MSIKEQLISACREYVNSRIDRINISIADLKESLKNETKSSAGDKYETGREMINLEFEKLSTQLVQLKKLNATLTMVENQPTSNKHIQFGSIVKTNTVNYFIAIPAGVLTINDENYYAIGANSPIAIAMNGKSSGEEIVFNAKTLTIEAVD
jgi:transcription elongation GreA/GreB family factor